MTWRMTTGATHPKNSAAKLRGKKQGAPKTRLTPAHTTKKAFVVG
ncbi:MAG TPA: hypothetical protein VJL39_00880 [Candidatus Paceibacterota bacterium]